MRKLTAMVLALAVLALLTGCASKRKVLMATGSPFQEAEQAGVTLSLNFLDEQQLGSRLRAEENPFLTQYSRMMLRRILVFELTAANAGAGPVELRLGDCELAFGEKRHSPVTPMQLASTWETLDKNRKTSRAKQLNVEKYVLPNISRIPPGGQRRGYLVFQGALPDAGAASLRVELRQGAGTLPFSFEYQF